MRLKSIKLAGFKSFVDPTHVHFPSNLCAVVGPNGCGKSNVIDAVRWVLGESSAKNLRGESMSDVIFNGSGTRKPVGQASIELIFDNSEGRVTGEFAAYTEIAVRRSVTRDGQSQYYLNGSGCRRRDITDIFLGTGLGPRSYAIIEQGTISRLIEAKPDELRIFIEEAAGISKYKERRRETESRMARAQDNLDRLKDIREELTRQLNRLERQAKSAKKYTEYKQLERRKGIELSALKWRNLDSLARHRQQLAKRSEVDYERLLAERNVCDTAIEKHRLESLELSDELERVQSQYYQISGDLARTEQEIEHARQRALERQEDIRITELNLAEANQHLSTDRDRAELWHGQYAALSPQLQQAEVLELQASDALELARAAFQACQQDVDAFNARSEKPRQQVEVQQSRIAYLESREASLTQRHDDLTTEAGSFQGGPERAEMLSIEDAIARLARDQKLSEGERHAHQQTITELRGSLSQNQLQSNQVREQRQALLGRQASLEALQQAALYDNEAQKWIAQQGWADYPRLAEAVDTDRGWEVAVESVLGNYLQAVMVSDIALHAEALQNLQRGEVVLFDTVLPELSERADQSRGKILSEFVRCDVARSLLASVYAVTSVAEALDLRPRLKPYESVITQDGVWFGLSWVRVQRDIDKSAGVLQRKYELQELGGNVQQLDQQLSELDGLQARYETALEQAELAARQSAERFGRQQTKYADLRSQLSAFEMQVEQFNARRQRAEAELAAVDTDRNKAVIELNTARKVLQEASDQVDMDTVDGDTLKQHREHLQNQQDACRKQLTERRDHRERLTIQVSSLETQRKANTEGILRLESQVERLAARLTELATFEGDSQGQDQQQRLQSQLASQLVAQQQLSEAKSAVEATEHSRRTQEQTRTKVDAQLMEVNEELQREQLAGREYVALRGAIEEQIMAQEGELHTLLESLAEDADPVDWEEELQLVSNRIQRLGPINLAAIDEFSAESERKSYLDRQNDELEDALSTLQDAIKKIDRETRARFKETFDTVNLHMQTLFPKLFGGGEAYMEITGTDLLDTGVTLMARPPGKKNSSIHALSGGEKAMTAIAMVFAIFKLNPAPFCMLDEVDAPLDDLNVSRYAAVVREMSAQVQFIVITHNKISMEAAHQLMGVTMHEAGVSRIVSVDVNQATKLAGSS